MRMFSSFCWLSWKFLLLNIWENSIFFILTAVESKIQFKTAFCTAHISTWISWINPRNNFDFCSKIFLFYNNKLDNNKLIRFYFFVPSCSAILFYLYILNFGWIPSFLMFKMENLNVFFILPSVNFKFSCGFVTSFSHLASMM